MYWIKDCQQVYGKKIDNLLSSSMTKRLPLVRQLQLFLDKAKLGGRIHNAPISQLAKFPYLLPPQHQFTSLLFHAGTNSRMTAICQKYWIPTAQQYIKTLPCHCVVCKRYCGRLFPAPDSAALPEVKTSFYSHWSRSCWGIVCLTH